MGCLLGWNVASLSGLVPDNKPCCSRKLHLIILPSGRSIILNPLPHDARTPMNKDLRPAPGELDPIETASRDEIASLQLQRLRWSLQHAYDHRSEEHTSELQSPCNLVCRLLLEK